MGFICHWEARQQVKRLDHCRSGNRRLHFWAHGKGSTGWGSLCFSLLSICGIFCLPGTYNGWQLSSNCFKHLFFHQIQICHSETLLIHTGIPLRSFPTSLIHLPQATCHLSIHNVHGSTLPTAFQDDDGRARPHTVWDEGRTEELPLSASGSTCLQIGLK